MEKGSVGKSTGKHAGFVQCIEIERFLYFRANGMGGLRIFTSKRSVFLRIPRFSLVGRQGESSFF